MRLFAPYLIFVSMGLALCGQGVAHAQARMEAAGLQQTSAESVSDHAAYSLPPEKLKLAIALNRQRTLLAFAEPGWQILQMVLLLVLGGAAWMRRVALGIGGNRWAQGYVFFFLFLAVTSLLSLPLEM